MFYDHFSARSLLAKLGLLKDWNIRIGITVNAVSEERKFNKKVALPHPKGVNKLTSYVKTKLRQSMYFVCIFYVPEGLLNTLI